MNKVIIINLNGNAYPLEEGGYEALRAYLDTAARRLEGNPDRDEIVADIEQALADKFREVLGAHKTVVLSREVEKAIGEIGPVEDGSEPSEGADAPGVSAAGATTGAASRPGAPASAKRLYRIREGAMMAGVCNGVAAYSNVDVTVVRVILVLLTIITFFTHGAGFLFLLAYIIMAFLIPKAQTSAEKASAHGASFTAQEFIRRAKEGYYEGMKSLNNKHEYREWKRTFKKKMRAWKHDFQREMRTGAEPRRTAFEAPPHFGFGHCIALPLLCLVNAVIALIWVLAAVSLIVTGAIFGILLPIGMHLWVALLLLVLSYKIIVWPLHRVRRDYHGAGYHLPFVAIWETMVWLVFILLIAWIASRHLPEIHELAAQVSPAIHDALDSIRQWWQQHHAQS